MLFMRPFSPSAAASSPTSLDKTYFQAELSDAMTSLQMEYNAML
jgi:hypothetical protein